MNAIYVVHTGTSVPADDNVDNVFVVEAGSVDEARRLGAEETVRHLVEDCGQDLEDIGDVDVYYVYGPYQKPEPAYVMVGGRGQTGLVEPIGNVKVFDFDNAEEGICPICEGDSLNDVNECPDCGYDHNQYMDADQIIEHYNRFMSMPVSQPEPR